MGARIFQRKPYTPADVKQDVTQFFTDDTHWAYRYGEPTPDCNMDCPYHRKQIEVILEDKYDHWDVNTTVDKLIDEGFLKLEPTQRANFVFRSDIRYYKREMKRRTKIIERYADPIITAALGNWGEKLVEYMFRLNRFELKGVHTNEFSGKKWTQTSQDLDFIFEKDSIAYGVEVKNTLAYMEADEFLIKLDICKFLGITPLWILRNASEIQFRTMKARKGFISSFKSQIYPYGQEPLVKEMWKKMRLPVTVRGEMPQKVVNMVISFHNANLLSKRP